MWHRLEMALSTPFGALLLILMTLLVILSGLYAYLRNRERKQSAELARRERYESIRRDGQ
jgi:hypothetical protein